MNIIRTSFTSLAFLLVLSSACGPRPDETVLVNTIQVVAGPVETPVAAGRSVEVPIAFIPWSYRITRKIDGSFVGALGSSWTSPNIAEMQYCTSLDTPCNLSGKWIPFVERPTVSVTVDWFGARTFWVTAEFHDAGGAIIPISVASPSETPKDYVQSSTSVTGVLDERTPVAAMPAHVQTEIAATRSVYPVTGFVKPARFFSGKVGTTIQVTVNLGATSPFGEVKEMRSKEVAAPNGWLNGGPKCYSEAELSQAAWEPFVAQESYSLDIPPIPPSMLTETAQGGHLDLGFAFYAVSVQYRDAKGNLSEVYCVSDQVGEVP
jgi:hypothetical protein